MQNFSDYNCVANFNSDFSGKVHLQNPEGERLEISGSFLIALVAEYVRRRRIAEIEQATTAELLGVRRM